MVKLHFILLSFCLYLYQANGRFLNSHVNLMNQFRKTTHSLNISCVPENWCSQPVDHFNQSDDRYWQQMYFKNMDKWRQGGPIYIFIGAEGELSDYPLNAGILFDLAVETQGAMFAVEHRYYGQSKPFPYVTRSNLKYLSSRQALADLANFIKKLKLQSCFMDSKVVVVGGSYGGNLAAWVRLLYPHLVDAAIASSAPVLAKLDFIEYYDTVNDDLKNYSKPECLKKITSKFDHYREVFKTQLGVEELKMKFNICNDTDMNKRKNQALFFNSMIFEFGETIQYGNIKTLKNICHHVPIPLIHYFDSDSNCETMEFDDIYNENCDLKEYLWNYQTCTEFGYFPLCNVPPFGDTFADIGYYVNICSGLFGSDFTRTSIEAAVRKTNYMYGGLTPNVTYVFFSHGEIDPWHKLGVLKDLSNTAPTRVIPSASHCADLLTPSTSEIFKIQAEEKMYIKKWIRFNS